MSHGHVRLDEVVYEHFIGEVVDQRYAYEFRVAGFGHTHFTVDGNDSADIGFSTWYDGRVVDLMLVG